MTKRLGTFATFAFWALAVASGFGMVARYESTPGPSGRAPTDWPAESRLPRDLKRPNLLMFVHPRCPCTLAGLAELARVAERCGTAAAIQVVFIRPEGTDEGWERSSAWRQARAIPGVTVRVDGGGVEARRFGAATSGHVLLFDMGGLRVFSGGITRGRGVAGANGWGEAVAELAAGRPAEHRSGPIFGCSLGGRCGKGGRL